MVYGEREMEEFCTGFVSAPKMLLVVNCWLFSSYCVARDMAGALQRAFSVVERSKKELL